MSDNHNKNTISGFITYPTENSNQENEQIPQPRQPQNLQGLLRFAMEATKAEDAPGNSSFQPLDEERKKFLEEALKSMTIDVIEILMKAIEKLKSASELSIDCDISQYTAAFENILDFIDNIDTANDFHKIGGYDIFTSCWNCVHSSIRASACEVLAELCQNNPYCQTRAFESGYVSMLLELLNNDSDEKVAIKALYAVSCLTRDFLPGILEFRKCNGLSVLLRVLEKPIIKLKIKTCFLLSSLCDVNQDLRGDIIKSDFLDILISCLAEPRTECHEHILSALLSIISDYPDAIRKCQNPNYGFKSILINHLKLIENIEEAVEEREYCTNLLKMFSSDSASIER